MAQVRLLYVTVDWALPYRRRRLEEAVARLEEVFESRETEREVALRLNAYSLTHP